MTKHSVIVCLSAFLAFSMASPLAARAELPGAPPATPDQPSGERKFPDPAEQFLKSAPASAVHKLKNPATASEGAAELNKYFGKAAINKWLKFQTTAEAVEPTPGGRNAARLRAASIPLEREGVTLQRFSWLYFPEQNAPLAEDVKVGSEFVIYGQVRRCEVVVTPDGSIRFDFDLWKSKITHL